MSARLSTTALALFAIPASAATMKAVYSGKVNYGYDMTGVFGTAGADLSGLDYVLTYVYDTSKGYRWTSGGYDQIYGGEWYGEESPVLSATLKIAEPLSARIESSMRPPGGVNFAALLSRFATTCARRTGSPST